MTDDQIKDAETSEIQNIAIERTVPEEVKDAILNAIYAAVIAYHTRSRGLNTGTTEYCQTSQMERDALWLADLCAEAAKKGMEGR